MPLDEEVKEIKGIQERKKEREAYMSSRGRKKAAMQRMLQQLRTATNSSAMNKASIIVDATKYMEELKQKVEGINSELGTVGSSSSTSQDELPMVTVETLERGFLINVFSERNCPGMLVAILEAFEELGLDVLDARVSCEDNFQLEAVGGEGSPVVTSSESNALGIGLYDEFRTVFASASPSIAPASHPYPSSTGRQRLVSG
ncbi:transcription factor SCREAM2 [Arachis duranensis]|uniref:Transcription factor SCREAM2 n=1 Tax=Arachis duranensis TaxID=130453 RepID=A0A6P4CHE4_ARADU|nr:transcription factor SCREAM2 [Arachis duranensis]